MEKELSIPEATLHEFWKEQKFDKPLQTTGGDSIFVYEVGEHNSDEGGPDFKNAKILIGNLTFVGDVEIDRNYSDWKSHKHNLNPKYNSVILHVVLENKFNQKYVYNSEGRKINCLALSDFVDNQELGEFHKKKMKNQRITKFRYNLKCENKISGVESRVVQHFVKDLGNKRFLKKAERIKKRLKEIAYLKSLKVSEPVINYDLPPDFFEKEFSVADFKNKDIWTQLFYEFLFEALGYSKNKSIMMDLAKSADIQFIEKNIPDCNLFSLEAAYFNIAGLAPKEDENYDDSDYSQKIKSEWEKLKADYDSIYFNETDWHFFKLRPHNFPTIRISGAARITKAILINNLLGKVIDQVQCESNIGKLIYTLRSFFIVKSDGYWKKHFVFGKDAAKEIKYFIGLTRSDEIVVNVLLPFLLVYSEIFQMEKFGVKILNIYYLFNQKSINKISEDVGAALNMKNNLYRSIFAQGLIELFRSYCSKNKCSDCEIGKIVFSEDKRNRE